MLNRIRNSKLTRYFSAFLALELIISLVPSTALALTSGPSQPEVQSFEPIATTDMVDPFTGDFNYNVPLMQVGNYPINIFYHAGIGMDDEASSVGLGWNINPGNLTRNMRGLPDDFKGDEIVTEQKVRPNNTYKVDLGLNAELLGIDLQQMEAQGLDADHDNDGSSLNFGVYYNNYKGIGYSVGIGLNIGCFSTNLGFDNQSGFDVDLSLEGDVNKKDKINGKLGASIGYNSRGGLSGLTLKASFEKGLSNKLSQKVAERGKKYSFTGRGSIGSSISFATQTYTPNFTPWMYNTSINLGVKLGAEISGSSFKGKIGVSFSTNYLKFKKSVHKGLGYIYSGSKSSLDGNISLDEDDYKYFGVLMDFNRDRESEINRKTRWLHTTNFTYDVYSAAGQGVSGFFRPYRNSVGNVSDPTNVVHNWSNTGITAELAAGNLFLAGADVSVGTYNGRSESWLDQNNLSDLSDDLAFSDDLSSSDPLDEPFYFKMAGEKSVNDDAFYNQIAGDKAIKIPLENKGKLDDRFVADGVDKPITTQIKRDGRDKRSQAITYLTAAEANRFGLDKSPKFYTYNSSGNELTEFLNRIDASAGRKEHHLSEITVINPDGTRYVYGIAAYNTEQSDYTFSVNENVSNPQNITYDFEDITLSNNKGRDKYFKKQTTPPYAHTYLLTAVLSPDYIDVSNNGPTEDDMGTYTKINYIRLYTDYAWRSPFGTGQASYNRGMISEGSDDKASIIFGKKEIWYVHSIESKTQIAKFYYSNRADSYGADGIDGGINSDRPLKKIDSITLYSKTDVNSNGFDDAIPIKTVHFTYDYSLCKSLPNNVNTGTSYSSSGKLTLKSFYFTYGFNTSGSLNQYKFDYGKNTAGVEKNQDYTEKYSDRWGNYKGPQSSGTATLKPWEHPYTEQNSGTANDNARMWNLTKIELPSGGIIRPTYEADDYKYVQDKKAMYMARVIGISDHADNMGDNQLYYTAGLDFNQNNFLHIQLPGACTPTQLEEHLKDIPELYFTFKVNLKKYNEPEIITGYAEIEDFGLNDGDNTKAWIKVKLVTENGRNVNPFSVSAWQYMRNMRPDLAYPTSDTNTDGIQALDIVYMMVGSLQQLFGTIAGMRTMFMMQRNAQLVDLNQCFVRIKCRDTGTDAGKIGGGYRISAIDFEDNWDAMTSSSEPKANYGQEFKYKLVDGTTSGVAAYEPGIGGDENSNRVPLSMDDDASTNPNVSITSNPLGPDDRFYVDGPVGEQFYPSPTVGYSRVVIRNKKPTGLNLARHGTGKIVHEFYTAKDFPVITDYEDIDTRFSSPFGIMSLLGVVSTNWGTASQGFSITTNDMHGKPRSISVYAETDDPESLAEDALISRTEYFYKQDGNKLVNDALTINKDGSIQEKSIGKEIEVVVDTKHKRDISINAGINLNLDAFLIGPFPVPVPTGFPDFQYTENDIRYAVCTKVVQRYGVLESTRVTENGSTLTTRNVLWDAETGEVLLTETQNEHNDNTYNLTLPAHWAYDGMGPAYKNINAQGFMVLNCLEGSTTMEVSDNSGIAHTLANDVFVPGDEVMLIPTVSGVPVATSLGLKAWVLDTIKGTGSERVSFIDQYGAPAVAVSSSEEGDKTYLYKIIRSGRRNQQSLPVGSFISRKRPFTSEGESDKFPMGQDTDSDDIIVRSLNFNVNRAIINASATEYSDKWQLFNGLNLGTDEYYSCSQKDMFSVPYFFNFLLNNGSFENEEGTIDFTPVESRLNHFISDYTGDDTITMDYDMVLGDVLQMQFEDGGEEEESFCSSWIFLKPLDNTYQPFIGGNNYFNDIVYFSAGGYITPTEKSYYDANSTDYYLLTAHTSTGNCFRFICYTVAESYVCVSFDDSECNTFDFVTCNGEIDACAPQAANTTYAAKTINPYQKSVRGIWRPLRSYAYNSSRNYLGDYLAGTPTTNIRVDGTYKDFEPFWTPNPIPNKDWVGIAFDDLEDSKWVWTEEVTKVSPYGFDVENKDALNRYSGAVYGYFNSLPVITGGNAKYCELAYDGFEDYDFPPILLLKNACLPKDHFSFNDVVVSSNLANVAHTGSKSLKVAPTDNFTAVRYITKPPVTADPNDDFMLKYKVQPEDTLPLFSPHEGKYIISAWAKDMGGTYANTSISVDVYDNTDNVSLGSYTLYAQTSQPVIEGWKRMEGSFVIAPLPDSPTHDVVIKIRPVNGNASADVYFDDIRIHPFNSMAKSYVYDPVRLRLIAQLDENNYATFYEYDEQGNLVRTKRETERGVMTIQENRQNIKKQ